MKPIVETMKQIKDKELASEIVEEIVGPTGLERRVKDRVRHYAIKASLETMKRVDAIWQEGEE